MNIIKALLMGLIQGMTEFLPVSSSGHLAIFKQVLGINLDSGMLFCSSDIKIPPAIYDTIIITGG